MLGQLFSYAASRIAGPAVDGLARRAVWGGLAAVLLLTSFVAFLLITFWTFEPRYGAVRVASFIAIGCIVSALFALSIPPIIEWAKKHPSPAGVGDGVASQSAVTLNEETKAAVDYFGALQVVASAFVFGLGAARRLRK